MQFELSAAIELLERTPASYKALLSGLAEQWTSANEGDYSWNAADVVAHVVYLDKANWLHRTRLILTTDDIVRFEPINRLGGKSLSEKMKMMDLLSLFEQTRTELLQEIKQLQITADQFSLKAIHPDFGEVRLSQLLSAWVVHDLSHLSQVSRILAKQYQQEVGPWVSFLRILN